MGERVIEKWQVRISKILGKYKYALAVILIGVVILLLPSGSQQPRTDPSQAETISAEREKDSLEQRLKTLLSETSGVGRAEVLLTLETGAECSFWQDRDADRQQTVYAEQGGERTPALFSQQYPKYRGAVIVCEGAETPKVQLAVKEAVSTLTGLGMDKITVIKMKGQ